jgi:hypothetical protein
MVRVVAFFLPILVMMIVEVLKRIPSLPVTSKNAKIVALVVSLALVVWQSYTEGTFTESFAVQNALEVVAVYVASVGIYETVKGLLKKI